MTDDEKLVRRVDEHGQNLTPWEIEFVSDMLERVLTGTPLTENQRAILERIDEEKVS